MRLVVGTLACAALLAGCGGSSTSTPPPAKKLPHGLAHEWAAQADTIASTIAAGDGCRAQQLAEQLRDDVIGAQGTVPLRYRSTLLGAVNDLADRITCTPPPTTVTVPARPHPQPGPKPKPPKHHGHGDH